MMEGKGNRQTHNADAYSDSLDRKEEKEEEERRREIRAHEGGGGGRKKEGGNGAELKVRKDPGTAKVRNWVGEERRDRIILHMSTTNPKTAK